MRLSISSFYLARRAGLSLNRRSILMPLLLLAGPALLVVAALWNASTAQGQEPQPPAGTTPKHFLFEIKGTAPPGDLSRPVALAEAEDGTLYLLDARDHQVRHIQRDGTVLEVWGSFGHADGQFAWPTDIDIGPNGSVYVLDGGNLRVQRFDSRGKHLVSWGSKGNQLGQFGGVLLAESRQSTRHRCESRWLRVCSRHEEQANTRLRCPRKESLGHRSSTDTRREYRMGRGFGCRSGRKLGSSMV